MKGLAGYIKEQKQKIQFFNLVSYKIQSAKFSFTRQVYIEYQIIKKLFTKQAGCTYPAMS